MKPCIIIWSKLHQRYEAYNEDGLRIKVHETFNCVNFQVQNWGFNVVAPNSRLARTILDKIDQRKAGMV